MSPGYYFGSLKIVGDGRQPYIEANISTIEDIEQLTGISFLPVLENTRPDKAKAVKKFKAPALWEDI